jgi:hypothetical protein
MESRPPSPPGAPSPAIDSRRSSLPLLLAGVLAIAAAVLLAVRDVSPRDESANSVAATAEAAASWTPAERPQGDTVSLEIDFGNGARRQFEAFPWSAEMTVGDLLRHARKFRPAIVFEHRGAGAKAFLTSLEGVANEGAGGRFWTYEVNGQAAQVGYDVQPLAPGDRVLWRFSRGE